MWQRRSELKATTMQPSCSVNDKKEYEETMNDTNTAVDRGGEEQDQGLRPPSPTGAQVYDRHCV